MRELSEGIGFDSEGPMPRFQVRIHRTFSASHQLRLPGDALEPLHGHNWSVALTVESQRLDSMDCVMDFHELERQLDSILAGWNNRHLNEVAPFAADATSPGVNPSAERVAQAIARRLALPAGVALLSVEVGEAVGCFAIYLPD